MIPLAILGALIYYTLYEILVYLNANNYYDSDPDQWGHWIDSPSEAKGAVGDILQYAQQTSYYTPCWAWGSGASINGRSRISNRTA